MDGLYLVEPHAKLIWEGKKKLIIKSVKLNKHVNVPLYLLGDKVYGIIILDKPIEIDYNIFVKLRPYHLITDKEKFEWWGDKQILYAYTFKFKKFEEPKDYTKKQGVQIIHRDVMIMSEQNNIYVKNLGHEAEVNKPPAKHPGYKPSCLIYSNDFSILIDVTKNIFDQLNIEEIINLDAILITHCHSDSIGGISKLNYFLKQYNKQIPLYAYNKNIAILKYKYNDLSQYILRPYVNFDTFEIKNVKIKPLFLYHDILEKFPTNGYTLYIGGVSVCYASDFGFPNNKNWTSKYDLNSMSNNELAILDGAYWEKKTNFWNHVSVLDHFSILAGLNNTYTYFTGYGNTYPKNLDLVEKVLNFYLQVYKKEIDPQCKIKKIGLVKDKQIFNLTEISKEV